MLSHADFVDAAERLRCDLPAIKAVAEVESSGSGFLTDGRPRILFEAHIFSRLTDHRYDASHPAISAPSWNRSLYRGGAAEHDRLGQACSLNRGAGLKSTSWGMFQIMGFNYAAAGFSDIQAFINAMYRSERDHLMAFANFIMSTKLDDELRTHRWQAFAHGYNGPGYAQNRYDIKLAKAWEMYGGTSA